MTLAARVQPVDTGFYRENGFLAIESLVSPEEVEAIRAEAVRICRGERICEKIPPVGSEVSDEEVIRRYLCVHQPHFISPYLREIVAHKGIAKVLTQLIGPNVKCMQSMLFLKPPRYPGQAWHQDEYYIPTRDRSLTGAWIALDDADRDNGCLWVIPGSHQSGYLYPQRDHERTTEFDFAQESYGFDEQAGIPVECRAGTVLFFNGYLLHRSRKNRSDRFRRVLVNHYMNAYSLLPWRAETKEGEWAARADYRGIVLVAGEDPYAWKGTFEEPGAVWVRTYDPKALEAD